MRHAETEHEVPPLGSTLWAGITGRCPACRRGKLFSGYLALAPRCDLCGLDYGFADSGDGPAVFVILVTGFIVTGLALITEIVYAPPYWLHAALWLPLGIILPLILLRSFKGVLIGLQFRHKAEEGKLLTKASGDAA
jgi:cytochrome c oxidase subunit 3